MIMVPVHASAEVERFYTKILSNFNKLINLDKMLSKKSIDQYKQKVIEEVNEMKHKEMDCTLKIKMKSRLVRSDRELHTSS